MSSTANQTSTANITSTINGAIITCSNVTGTTCHMTATSATYSTHGVEHATAATCITTAATILETRGTSEGGVQRQTGKSTTSQKPPGGNLNIFAFYVFIIFNSYIKNVNIDTVITYKYFSGGDESSESETDNNEDSITCVKFLLLVDQLSIDQHHHLSIKDIGNLRKYFLIIVGIKLIIHEGFH